MRHQAHQGGDRQANSALHGIAPKAEGLRDPETAGVRREGWGRERATVGGREVPQALRGCGRRYRALMRPTRSGGPEDARSLGGHGARRGSAR